MRNPLIAIVIALASCGLSAAAEKKEPLPTFEETCFQVRSAGSFVTMTEAQGMLEGIWPESRISAADHEKVRLRGLFRIRDWTPDVVVRISLVESLVNLRIHVWGEGGGLCVYLHKAIAAYRLTQDPGATSSRRDPKLILSTLVATDDQRGARLPPGACQCQIRCQNGAIVVTVGNVRVITAPLEGPAKALYLEVPSDAMLRDLALLHSGPAPEEIAPLHRLVLDGKQPSGLAWKETLPAGGRFQKLADGCVEVATDGATQVAMASVAVPGPGLYEVVAQIDDASAGAGIALLNTKGEPLEGIEFGRESKTKPLAFGFGTPREQPWLGNVEFGVRVVPLAGPRQWLRLVVAGGLARCWISGDGVHWGRALDGRDRCGAWQTIALYAREAGDPKRNPDSIARHIRLRSLQVRELSGLTAAAPADLLAKAAVAGVQYKTEPNESPADWTARIARLAPTGCSPLAWRYACTLCALSGRIYLDQAEALFSRAVREQLNELHTFAEKIRLLQDAALVWRFRQDDAQRQLELWDGLGREVLNSGTRADFERYQQALIQTSFGDPPEHSGPISGQLAFDAMLLFYAEHRDADLARMEQLVAFWRANHREFGYWPLCQQLDQWFNSRPTKGRGRKRWSVGLDVTRAMTPPLNRAACNIVSELQSALDGRQYADAAGILFACVPPHDEGLVPAPGDDLHFTSFQTALRLLILGHRGFSDALARQIGPADQLKIEQTLARGDPAAIEILTVQYCGTPAAVPPCQWLGDRALAAADLAQAMSWYDEGLRWAAADQQPDLAARKRLLSAMLGSVQGQPPTQPVLLGGVKVSPEQLEGWVRAQLSRRRTVTEAALSADLLPLVASPQPIAYQAASFGQLNDAQGRGFQGNEAQGPFRDVDWTWRHLTLLAGGDSLLAVERSHVAAFGLGDGKLRWDFRLRNAWSTSPVWPLLYGPKIYIRATAAPERVGVACLDSATGRKLWLCDCGGTAASDPLWYRGRLFVLTIGPASGSFASPLCLVELRPETGDVLSRQPIVETTEREKFSGECQASWAGNRLVVLLPGSVICTDLQGRMSWFRQETTLPYAIDSAFVQQYCQPAIDSEGRLFVQQPGSCAIDCLALDTGQRNWRRGIVGLQRIVDLPDDRLLVRTVRGLVALKKTTGEVLWQREFAGMLSALARSTSGLLLCARQAMIGDKPQLVFLWIDSATGQTRAHSAMPLEQNKPILFGPIAARGDRTWCGFGYGAPNDSPTAENYKRIIELRPGKPAVADEGP